MSFESLFGDGGSAAAPYGDAAMPSGTVPESCLVSHSFSKPTLSSPGLSLGLQTNMDGQAALGRIAVSGGLVGGGDDLESLVGRNKDEENESRSGSDNLGGLSGDGLDDGQENPRKRKRYHRHTPQQIQELEGLFKECPHPDEKQRMELSKRLKLAPRQVKFWFQNRRTQMKMQIERHENSLLRQENDRLRAENMSIRDAMRSPMCTNCGGPAVLGEVSFEEQHLKIENARLKDELDRVCAIAEKFLGRPISSMSPPIPPPLLSSSLELGVGNNGYPGLGSLLPSLQAAGDFVAGGSSPLATITVPPVKTLTSMAMADRSLLLELALAAMDELVKMAQMGESLWVPSLDGGSKENLNFDEYLQAFPRCIGMKPAGFLSEATRETGMVIISSLALVETLMDDIRWTEMFPDIIARARATTTDVISSGMGGTRNGALQLMHAELQVLSPLVPIRDVNFLRFCKQLAEGVWAVVDVSIDAIRETQSTAGTTYISCRRLPSGFVVQDMPNGYSKVTWVEHAEYDESSVHQLYLPLLRSGMGLGAQRWLSALQRQCECLAILMSTSVPSRDPAGITPAGRRSMLKLAARMTSNFCAGVCASSARKWSRLSGGAVAEDMRVMTRQSVDNPGEPPGVVLSAATSVWLPVSPQRVFEFLRDERLRSEWDILSNGGPMQEMAHIAKGQDHGNAVSLLRASAVSGGQSSMLILQETSTDASGSMVVYAPVDVPAMHVVMSGGDSAYVALLPSGFAILPDGPGSRAPPQSSTNTTRPAAGKTGGSLLTVAFQILVNSLPTAKLTVESVETVNNLISCTIQKIRAALNCEA